MTDRIGTSFRLSWRTDLEVSIVLGNGATISAFFQERNVGDVLYVEMNYLDAPQDNYLNTRHDMIEIPGITKQNLDIGLFRTSADTFLVSWTDPTSQDTVARLYDDQLARASDNFTLAVSPEREWLTLLSAATSPDDELLAMLAYTSGSKADPADSSLIVSLFDPGQPGLQHEILIPTPVATNVRTATASVDSEGVRVIWIEESASVGDRVRTQVFAADGTELGAASTLALPGSFDADQMTRIATLRDGTMLVVWVERSQADSGADIKAKLFGADGAVIRDTFVVNAITFGDQALPTVAALDNGGFVVTWNDNSHAIPDITDLAARGQAFDAVGNRVGSEFMVSIQSDGSQSSPKVFGLEGDEFAVLWNHYEFYNVYEQYRTKNIQYFEASDTSQLKPLTLQVDKEVTTGSILADTLFGDSDGNFIVGEAGNDTLYGGFGGDILNGYTGDDILCGGLPKGGGPELSDTLTGGEGSDQFLFNNYRKKYEHRNSKLLADHITDFEPGADSIVIIAKKFKKIGPAGALDPGKFAVGTACTEKDDRILYNPKKGWLSYDRDGSKKHNPVIFAIIDNDAEVHASDIFVL